MGGMTTTGIFTIHEFSIPCGKYNEPKYLIPFGDVHRSSDMFAKEKWHDFLDWARKKRDCYFLGMGDYDDLASTTERIVLGDNSLHTSTVKSLEQLYRENTAAFCKEISFMKGRLLGLVEGNHYGKFSSGITTTQLMCQNLECKYLGVSSFIRLKLVESKSNILNIDLFAHHGKGGGKRTGSSINSVEDMMRIADAQIYLMGHDHRKSVSAVNKLYLTEGNGSVKIDDKRILLIRTGSFLKGYENNTASYVADGAYSPTDLGVVKIELTPKRVRSKPMKIDKRYIDIHASI